MVGQMQADARLDADAPDRNELLALAAEWEQGANEAELSGGRMQTAWTLRGCALVLREVLR
jgi:hypothetical protein